MRHLIDIAKFLVLTSAVAFGQSQRLISGDYGDGTTLQKNGVKNGHAEANVASWSTYDDAAAAPVDCTGGSVTTTFTRSTSSPLDGAASFLITKDAANRQGEGAAYSFSIPSGYSTVTPTMHTISALYTVPSGTYDYSASDLTAYIYDVTNAQVIQPIGFKFDGGAMAATFQPNSTSSSYRLCLHIATTSTSAWTMKIDNVSVGPVSKSQSPVVTAESLTYPVVPNASAFGTVTNNAIYTSRVGDKLLVSGSFQSGTVAAAEAYITLPFTIDTTKMGGTGADAVCTWYGAKNAATAAAFSLDGSTANVTGVLFYDGGSNPTRLYFSNRAATNSYEKRNANSLFSSNDSVGFFCKPLPIAGWGGTNQTSDQNDGRVVKSRYSEIAGGAYASGAVINYANKEEDSHSMCSSGSCTVPMTRRYKIGGAFYSSSYGAVTGDGLNLSIYKNGSQVAIIDLLRIQTNNTAQFLLAGSTELDLIKGDVITLRHGGFSGSPNASGGATLNYFTIESSSGGSQIAASESVNAKAGGTATGGSGAASIIIFPTKSWDSHDSYSTSTGRLTVRVSGKYEVCARVNASNSVAVALYKNAAQGDDMFTSSVGPGLGWGCAETDAVVGDLLDVRTISSSIGTHGSGSWVTFKRVGN